jgi:hypothetical protein
MHDPVTPVIVQPALIGWGRKRKIQLKVKGWAMNSFSV